MTTLTGGVSYLDLQFQNVPGVIATVVLHSAGGVALVDPGPSSTLPALRAGLERAGIALADVTIFDPATIRDVSTFDDPKHYSTGIRHVLVNGRRAVADGVITSERAGRPLRGPGYRPSQGPSR